MECASVAELQQVLVKKVATFKPDIGYKEHEGILQGGHP